MKINFKCIKCGQKAWFQVHSDYLVKATDLICDDCVKILCPDIENDEVPEPIITFKEA